MYALLLTTLLALMNASRATAHVGPLAEDPALQARAQARAERMCAAGQFSHDGFETAFRGLAYRSYGENLAMGNRDPGAIHAQLMNSPGHRANILRAGYGAVGVGTSGGRCNITVELFGGR
jgi:uncharacterized protein YkwD